MANQAEQKWSDRAWKMLDRTLTDYVTALSTGAPQPAPTMSDQSLKIMMEGVLAARNSYRDGILIQLAYALSAETDAENDADFQERQEGGRNVAKSLGALCGELHIPGVKDAFQNIGKNSANLARGNVPAFDDLLAWINGASPIQRGEAFEFLAATTASMARPVLPFPELHVANLTFARVVQLINAMLETPSGGAFEQFLLAAFVHGLLDEYSLAGRNGVHVETKNINASDASSRSASDVQVKRGNRFEEAFEVTANDWSTKPADAVASMKAHDLARIHIAARVSGGSLADVSTLLALPSDEDVSVLDLRALLHGLTAFMRKPARATALKRLYEFLDRHQPDIERTNAYVRLLTTVRVTA
ncbi:MAG: hypothetical protein VX454_04145 [Pseudomonadota bacterium]|nr:hypothetical protein [Pseudomonadota bacterium]